MFPDEQETGHKKPLKEEKKIDRGRHKTNDSDSIKKRQDQAHDEKRRDKEHGDKKR